MTQATHTYRRTAWRLGRRAGAVCLVATWLMSCGGEGPSKVSGDSTGGTGALAAGPISGLGSIVLHGVRYDDTQAQVNHDDDTPSSRAALQLGMVVELQGVLNSDESAGVATRVAVQPELIGPITALDVNAGTFTVWGRTVRSTPSTVFADGSSLLAQLRIGHIVEVHGLLSADSSLVATRITREADNQASFVSRYKLRGSISELSGTAPAWRFNLGSIMVQTDANTRLDGSLQNGTIVHARLTSTPDAEGRYRATWVQSKPANYAKGLRMAELEGLVSGLTSLDAPFLVNGYPVVLSPQTQWIGGDATELVAGVRVAVKGVLNLNVLQIRRVKFERDTPDGGTDGTEARFTLYDDARCLDCGLNEGMLSLRGQTVVYDRDTRWGLGLNGITVNGMRVAAHAETLIRNGTPVLRATRIDAARN